MKLTLQSRKKETPDVESFIFKPEDPIQWKAGQFFHYVFHHRPTDDRGSDRWFTIASAPYEEVVMITTRFAKEKGSSFKQHLKDLKVGETIEVSELEGSFTIKDLTKEYVFIAGGIGITPFRSILKELDHHKKKISVTLLYANKDHHVAYKHELETLAKHNPNLKIHYIFSPEHIDEEKVKEVVPDLEKPLFYVSGPEQMVEKLKNMLEEMEVPTEHIKRDSFPGYPEDGGSSSTPPKTLLKQALSFPKKFIQGHMQQPTLSKETLPTGEGAVIEESGQKIAAYKDEDGKVTTHSAVCTHLGCIVGWNNQDKTWDCPCHGSRFSKDGRVMNGPAKKDLPPA